MSMIMDKLYDATDSELEAVLLDLLYDKGYNYTIVDNERTTPEI